MRHFLWIPLACLLAACGSFEVPPVEKPAALTTDPAASTLDQARAWHFAGLEGDVAANQRALALLRELLGPSPDDPRTLAYFGSARLLEAREMPPLLELYTLSSQGLSALDRAVELAPTDWEVRFLRGMACRHLPGFFNRARQSAQDLALVAGHAAQAVQTGDLEVRFATAALYYHGLNLQADGRLESAKVHWQKAVALGPDTPGGQAATRRLTRRP